MLHQKKCKGLLWDEETDFIVVGMGPGGSVVLRTLLDAGFAALGIEAGVNYDDDPLIINATNSGILESQYTWKFFYNQETLPNPNLNDMTMNYTTGRMLGGGSSINGMQYVRSTTKFWQKWADLNGSDWNPESVTQGFRELEKFVGVTGAFDPSVHGFHGLMQIREAPIVATIMATKFATALSTAVGQPIINDYNDPSTPLGTFTRWSLFQQQNGLRASSSIDFLQPILKNIILNTTVSKVIFRDNVAIGIEAIQNGKTIYIKANKEVILSTGIHSNEILQRSGIGPKNLLKSLDIPIIFANEAVGSNSVNQLINIATFTAPINDSPGVPANDPAALYVGGAFLPDPTPGFDQSKRGYQWIGINPAPGLLSVAFYELNPVSLGTDHLQDKDPFRVSAMAENLGNPADINSIINVYQQQIIALNNEFIANYPGYQLLAPPVAVINDTNALTDYITNNLDHTHHWTGTCRMAPLEQNGVVDPKGRVHGVYNLRIADISVAPYEPVGNTAGPAFLVGHKIAGFLLDKYR